jgi:hypothetical protein
MRQRRNPPWPNSSVPWPSTSTSRTRNEQQRQ